MLRLIDDWKSVLKHAWSIRLILIAGLLSGLEVVLPYFSEAIPRGIFALAVVGITMLALWARITAQKTFHDKQ